MRGRKNLIPARDKREICCNSDDKANKSFVTRRTGTLVIYRDTSWTPMRSERGEQVQRARAEDARM